MAIRQETNKEILDEPSSEGPIMVLQTSYGERTINDFLLLFKNGQINLNPGFQRRSVWSPADRQRLIQSIASKYPLPSVFLYQRLQKGGVVYDVVDGKQRLETILMFTRQGRFRRRAFEARLGLDGDVDRYDWKSLRTRHPELYDAFLTYKVQTAEVTGDLAEIVDLFVRINSTGKPLTSGEKRNARFYKSPFLKAANGLVAKFQGYFVNQQILSETQIDRMKGTELVSELLMSVHHGGIINKKTSLDRAIGNESVNLNTLGRLSRECTATMNLVRRMFPDLKTTRFRNSADFYSLFMIVWEMRSHHFVLTDRKRNKTAELLMKRLSNGVDELRDQLRKAKPAKSAQRLYADYLLTVQGDTDSSANRERRAEILRSLLISLFERKDEKRTFTPEQRRLLWNNDEKKSCPGRPGHPCGKQLTWENFTVDHILAHSRGGPTSLRNAQLMCRSCNSSKRDR
jgi:hypothetical protein